MGGVSQWCADWYSESPGETIDPRGPAEGLYKASRGGARDVPDELAVRGGSEPGNVEAQGFRVLLEADAPDAACLAALARLRDDLRYDIEARDYSPEQCRAEARKCLAVEKADLPRAWRKIARHLIPKGATYADVVARFRLTGPPVFQNVTPGHQTARWWLDDRHELFVSFTFAGKDDDVAARASGEGSVVRRAEVDAAERYALPPAPLPWGEAVNGLSASLSLQSKAVRAGEDIRLRLAIRTHEKPVLLHSIGDTEFFGWEVACVAEPGRAASLSFPVREQGRIDMPERIILPAGAVLPLRLQRESASLAVRLRPGRYALRAIMDTSGGYLGVCVGRDRLAWPGRLESNVVQLNVE